MANKPRPALLAVLGTDDLADQRVTLVRWVDTLFDEHPRGTDTDSIDTLRWWTPTLGPSAALIAHGLAAELRASGDEPVDLPAVELARRVGLGRTMYRWLTAIERLAAFQIVTVAGQPGGHLAIAVRRRLGPLSRRQQDQLPPQLRTRYSQ